MTTGTQPANALRGYLGSSVMVPALERGKVESIIIVHAIAPIKAAARQYIFDEFIFKRLRR
jgi:hypothetical protein